MKRYAPIVIILCAVKLIIHLAGNQRYGFQRDELLHLTTGYYPAWGYFEFPPLIAWIAKISLLVSDHSLTGMRLFSTLAGMAILVLCCMMAKELGGKRWAVLLAGICVLAFIPYWRNHCLFQPVAFDQLLWTVGFYFVIRYMKTERPAFLIYTGITAGLGMMNKYTFVIWLAGILAAMIVYKKGAAFKSRWVYIAGAIALLIFLPNLIWQWQHDIPFLLHMKRLQETQLEKISVWEFVTAQTDLPFTLLFSVAGLYWLFRQRAYRGIGAAVILMFLLMWVLQSKGYYFYAAYPVMFAAGAVQMESWLQEKPWWNVAVAAVLILPVAPFLPEAIPILPIEKYISYTDKQPDSTGHYTLTGDYADMFGWPEQVSLMDSVYNTLPPADQRECIFLAENYGEAGALKILGRRDPVCRHGSFWTWGPGPKEGKVAVSIGFEEEVLQKLYHHYTLVRYITHPYAIDEENNIPVYICRDPIISMQALWPTLEKRVFE